MKPKEKAKELVDEMQYTQRGFVMPFIIAKQCALIAVNEIIENLVELSNGEFTFIHNVEYWQKVRTEIEKL